LEIDTRINFINVTLTELSFKLNKKFKPLKDGIPVEIDFKTKNSFSSDKKTLTTILSVLLFRKTRNKPFVMRVSVEGIFEGKSYEELIKFSKIHAPAHLFPFIREIIGNTTMKANIPPLLLPPFNLAAFLTARRG
jgi:preprotein translocase subunit SecB